MKSLTIKMFLTLGSVCVFGTGLYAQSYKMTVDVPFPFEVAGTTQQPGHYVVGTNSSSTAQMLSNATTRHSIFIPAGASPETNTGKPRLTFHRYGDQYFLAAIWNPEGTGSRLPMPKREKEARETAKLVGSPMGSVDLIARR
jgi:hypothetical protein